MVLLKALSLTFLLGVVVKQAASATGSSRYTSLATYNAGLVFGTIGNVDARLSVLIDQMIQSDVDIFCLQEAWTADVQRKIRRDLKPFYPYALSAIDLDTDPSDTTTPSCPQGSVDATFDCRALNCAGLSGLAFGVCGTLRCTEEFTRLPDACITCLLLEFNRRNETECLTLPASNFERTFGLMLLSKKELLNPTANPFNNYSQIRGYLTASVSGVGALICTHLSTLLAPPPLYIGPPVVVPFLYSSYAEQHRDEVMTLFHVIMNSGMEVPILLGDFNHGPARTGGVVAEFPFYYGLVNARGFVSPYVLKDGRCTYCIDNPLTGGIFPSTIIDHIYITTDTTERVIYAKRFLDEVFPSIGISPSDHFGVKVRLSNIRQNCNFIQKCRFHCTSEIKELSPFLPDFSDVCFD